MTSIDKPVCGSGDTDGEYNLALHTAGLCESMAIIALVFLVRNVVN